MSIGGAASADSVFDAARLAGLEKINSGSGSGVGTLSERSLHCILKYWVQPDDSMHEISLGLGKIIADVFDGQSVTEIQTGSFYPLNAKLERLLEHYPVTVIYPIAMSKNLIWIDPASGESTKPRKSPKQGQVWSVFPELIHIRRFLTHPGLTVKLAMMDMDEYRLKNGWSRDGKKGGSRVERIPAALHNVVTLASAVDYLSLLPDSLEQQFTCPQLAAVCGVRPRVASSIVYVMRECGYIVRNGKKGNAYVYERARLNQ